jgi:hypothetical protein
MSAKLQRTGPADGELPLGPAVEVPRSARQPPSGWRRVRRANWVRFAARLVNHRSPLISTDPADDLPQRPGTEMRTHGPRRGRQMCAHSGGRVRGMEPRPELPPEPRPRGNRCSPAEARTGLRGVAWAGYGRDGIALRMYRYYTGRQWFCQVSERRESGGPGQPQIDTGPHRSGRTAVGSTAAGDGPSGSSGRRHMGEGVRAVALRGRGADNDRRARLWPRWQTVSAPGAPSGAGR